MAANPQDAAELKETLSEKEETFEMAQHDRSVSWTACGACDISDGHAVAECKGTYPRCDPVLDRRVVDLRAHSPGHERTVIFRALRCFRRRGCQNRFRSLCRPDHLPVPGQLHARRGDGDSWVGQTLRLRHHVHDVCRQQHGPYPACLWIHLRFPVDVDQQHGGHGDDVSHCPGHRLRHGRHHGQADRHAGRPSEATVRNRG